MGKEQLIADIRILLTESLAKLDKDAWATGELVFQAPPAVNKGTTSIFTFQNAAGEKAPFRYTGEWGITLKTIELFIELNRDGKINELIVRATNDGTIKLEVDYLWNEAIFEDFQANLPKSKRGKIIPWYTSPAS
jgi:hypothetical protein